MSRIALHGLVKEWNGQRAVDEVSFTLEAGEFLALLGPSGCGKSTTLRLIAGLDQPSAGRIEIGGRDVTHLPPAQRQIAMVFQSYALFPHLTVAENIVFGLKVRGLPKAERARRLAEVAELVGLQGLLERKPAALSGGQRQRVALARAVVARAPVCLMDEPLSNLDAQLRQQMRQEIRALQRQLGITMIYVTHDQTEAMTMADQVVLMRAGRVEQMGSPAELYARPETTFAARFLGAPAMNLLPGSLFAQHHRLPADPATLTLGLRPERLDLCAPGEGLPAVVENLEYLGAESVLGCRIGEHAVQLRLPGRHQIALGSTVGIAWRPEDLHYFDHASGKRVTDTAEHRVLRPVFPSPAGASHVLR